MFGVEKLVHEIVKKFDEKLDTFIERLDTVIEKLDETNSLLRDIKAKSSKRG